MRAVLLTLVACAWSLEDVVTEEICHQDECRDAGLSLLQLNARKTVDSEKDEDEASPPGDVCRTGLRSARFCCGGNCGQCGGMGCQNRPGGGNACCTNQIRRSGRRCTTGNMQNCMIPSRSQGNSMGMGMGRGMGVGVGRPEPPVPPIDISEPEIVSELALCETSLVFDNVLHSNLGGAGPDSGSADLTFGGVAPGTNLVITALSPYTPNSLNPSGGILRNGARNGFGVVNLASGSGVDLSFQLQDAATGAAKIMDNFVITFVDGDHGMSHESRESVTVSGFSAYTLDTETTLLVENARDDDDSLNAGNGMATFVSTLRGSKQDNPESSLALSRLQSRRSVAIMFENKSEFTATASEQDYANPQGRNIFFTGASNLICPREARCSSYQCPATMRQRQNAEFSVCASRPCTIADQDSCCIAV